MFGKKMGFIVLIGVGAVSFAASFGLSYMFGKKPQPVEDQKKTPANATKDTSVVASLSAGPSGKMTPAQEQMKELISRLRNEKAEYLSRNQRLEQREKRLRIAREMIAKEAKELQSLRDKLVAPLMRLKELKAELEKTRVLIRKEEKANLKKTSGIYEKMDSSAASRILEEMCLNNQEDDVVRILYYMSPRSAAEILAGIRKAGLAGRICDRLKRIREEGK